MSFRDVTIKIPDRGYDQGFEVTSRTASVGGDLRKVSELSSWHGRRRLTCGAARVGGQMEKVSIERWYLYPYVEKPFNSKVIKSFVPELRSRKCFCVSGFLCYLCMSYKHFAYAYLFHGYVTK